MRTLRQEASDDDGDGAGALNAGGQRLAQRNRSLALELRFHISVGWQLQRPGSMGRLALWLPPAYTCQLASAPLHWVRVSAAWATHTWWP